jgi:hypothetical protein
LREELVIVEVSGGGAAGAFFDGVSVGTVDVGYRDDLIWVSRKLIGGVEQAFHAVAGADDAEAERIVGTEDAG